MVGSAPGSAASQIAGIELKFPDVFYPGSRVALEFKCRASQAAILHDTSLNYVVFSPGFVPSYSRGSIKIGLEDRVNGIGLEAGIFPESMITVLIYKNNHLIRVSQIPIIRSRDRYFAKSHSYLYHA